MMSTSCTEIPRRFGDYELVGHLGTGGLASAYLAYPTRDDAAPCVVRLVQPLLASSKRFHEQLLAEACALGRVESEFVVRVLASGWVGEQAYAALEYVRGINLRHLQRGLSGAFPVEVAGYIVERVLLGLGEAHERLPSVIHGDLSPSNILVGFDGSIKLTDFSASSLGQVPHPQWGINTAYASPQTALGEPASVSSDLFSAAVILWELSYGKRYYQTAVGLPRGRPPTPDEVIEARVPSCLPVLDAPGLPALLRTALAGYGRERFSSAAQFRQALVACLDEVGVLATRGMARWLQEHDAVQWAPGHGASREPCDGER